MSLKALRFLRRINLVHSVCDHLVGEHHTHKHRCVVGTGIMVVGVAISKSAVHANTEFLESVCNGVGYLIHGIGATPWV